MKAYTNNKAKHTKPEGTFISCTNQKTITINIPKYLQNKTLKDPHKY